MKIPFNKNTLIIGLGNPLMGDDGVGNYVVAYLLKESQPSNMTIIDCGTDVLKITSHIKNQDQIIIIDALDAGKSPGTIFYLKKNEILNFQGKSSSVHMLSVVESIKLLDKVWPFFRKLPITLIGIQPDAIRIGQGLSKKVAAAAGRIVENLNNQV